MSTSADQSTPIQTWADEALGVVRRQVPERWRARLGMLRGIFVKEPVDQMRKIWSVIRHFDTYQQVDRALFYHRYASTLLVAYQLGIFEAVDEEATAIDEIAGDCGIEPEAARNILRMLESQQLVVLDGDEVQATDFAREFLADDSPVSLGPMLDIGVSYAEAFSQIVDGARTGETAGGLDVFDDAGRSDALLDGVNAYLDQAGRELIARVKWPDIEHLIVGSMGVSFSSLLLSEFSNARVTYGCLPHLTERIPRLRDEYGVDSARVVETHGHSGEPTQDQWGREAFDLVFLTKKMVLDPQNNLGDKFARKALRVLNPGGVTVFWETIHEDAGPTPIERAMEGFLDFGVSPTGPVLSRDGFRKKLRNIGYGDVDYFSCLDGATTFVVARKPNTEG